MSDSLKTLLDDLMQHEARVWDALVRRDAVADEAALAPEFLGVYPSGFATRADHVAQLQSGPSVLSYQLADPRVLPLGAEFAVLSYRAEFTRTGDAAEEQMYVSSIWRKQGANGWINIFSQDTPVAGPSAT